MYYIIAIAYKSGDIINDKYRITDILGKGGVAITYSAIALETESPVAIKVISLKQLQDWKEIELFQREAEVLAKLDHPAIPNYIDYFALETEKDKAFYLVQQQAPGKSLAQLVDNGWHTTEQEVKNIAQQILEILIYLHSLEPPVIHRDIKPNNLILSDQGEIYLVDFGAVQNTYYNTLMQGSTVVGTYGYMAPEQFRGKALPATDLYGLGATLLYLLTHRSPAELPQDTLKLDFRSSVDISESFADWLDKILEPDIEDRFTSAELALNKLFARKKTSKKKSQKKLITHVVIGMVAVSLILGINSYKWFFLSRLGFYPANVCSWEVLNDFLKQGGNINSIKDKEKNSILFCVIAQWKLTDKAKLLVKYNVDVNAKDSYGRTALLHTKSIDIVRLLIDNDADVNARDNNGKTALLHTNNIEIAKLLIDNGADVNARDNNGKTALLHANNIEIAKLLIDNGSDVNVQDSNGKTALLHANNIEIAKLLIDNGSDVNVQDSNGETPLFKVQNIDKTKLLIDNGADVNIQDKQGYTALNKAISQEKTEIVKLLIENGADVKVKNRQGSTVLFNAASKNKIEIVKLLLEHGADARIKNKYDESPLVNVKTKEIAELLIEYGADVNAQKRIKVINHSSSTFPSNTAFGGQIKYGSTPLFNAISRENIPVVKLLLKNGADINIKINRFQNKNDQHYNTPLFKAVDKNNIEIVRLLLEYGVNLKENNADGKSILFYVKDKNIAKLLIDNGADVNARDSRHQNTPLFTIDNSEIIKLLISHGADVNARNNIDNTPIFNCIHINEMKLLIDNGADVNAINKYGDTPLLSCIDQEIDREDIIKMSKNLPKINLYSVRLSLNINLLIFNGADVNAINLSGQTPISKAVYKQQRLIVELLIENNADTSYLNPKKIREVHQMSDKKYLAIKKFLQKNKFDKNKR